MKTFACLAPLLLVAAAAPAFAQADADAENNFTGPRAEMFGSWVRNSSVAHVHAPTETIRAKDRNDMLTVGGLVGYDVPIGDHLVAGVLGSYAMSTGKSCTATRTETLGSGCFKTPRDIEGGARLGYKLLGGKALGYVKGAYVNTEVRSRLYKPDGSFGNHDTFGGWRAGAGLEYALSRHFYVKAEYDYTDFGKFNAADKPYEGLRIPNTSIALNRNQVQGGFGIRF